jgi:hypothetical protein
MGENEKRGFLLVKKYVISKKTEIDKYTCKKYEIKQPGKREKVMGLYFIHYEYNKLFLYFSCHLAGIAAVLARLRISPGFRSIFSVENSGTLKLFGKRL